MATRLIGIAVRCLAIIAGPPRQDLHRAQGAGVLLQRHRHAKVVQAVRPGCNLLRHGGAAAHTQPTRGRTCADTHTPLRHSVACCGSLLAMSLTVPPSVWQPCTTVAATSFFKTDDPIPASQRTLTITPGVRRGAAVSQQCGQPHSSSRQRLTRCLRPQVPRSSCTRAPVTKRSAHCPPPHDVCQSSFCSVLPTPGGIKEI